MLVWEEIDDVQLLKIAQTGDSDAFGELYERYSMIIFRFLYVHLNNRLDAEDLTTEVFMKVWRSLPNYKQQGPPFVAYLYKVARNALIDHHRHAKSTDHDLIEDERTIDFAQNPAELALDNLEYQELRQLLVQLREDYRDVLVLRFLSELSPEETAEVMDRSVGAVRVLQHRALTAVRSLLEKDSGKLQ